MNFKDISKTLPNVREIINVQSRFGQFKRYIDQGKNDKTELNNPAFQ